MSKEYKSHWFTEQGSRDPIGIIQVAFNDNRKYYIGTGKGEDVNLDIKMIVESGAKFPNKAGDALFS